MVGRYIPADLLNTRSSYAKQRRNHQRNWRHDGNHFCHAFLEKLEDAIRQVAHQRGRTYKSLTTAVRNGMGRRWWLPAVRLALAQSLYAAASTDTSTSQNRLREEALKQSIKTYPAVHPANTCYAELSATLGRLIVHSRAMQKGVGRRAHT